MSASSGMNGWSSKAKAKQAYLRRHNVRTPDAEKARVAAAATAPPLAMGGGLASISEQLYERVVGYHAQIGSGVSASALLSLEASLLDEAERVAAEGAWEEALNTFTHALAVTEKVRAVADAPTHASTQASIVANIGTCLHHLGELEAVRSRPLPTRACRIVCAAPPHVRRRAHTGEGVLRGGAVMPGPAAHAAVRAPLHDGARPRLGRAAARHPL
jgi:hypothetical protein